MIYRDFLRTSACSSGWNQRKSVQLWTLQYSSIDNHTWRKSTTHFTLPFSTLAWSRCSWWWSAYTWVTFTIIWWSKSFTWNSHTCTLQVLIRRVFWNEQNHVSVCYSAGCGRTGSIIAIDLCRLLIRDDVRRIAYEKNYW